jgi:glycosyltransferase involved in cell wall biosynthesis
VSDLSIIIPTFNRAASLARTLKSIAAVARPSDAIEILVIDNGSTDQTQEVYNSAKAKNKTHEWRYFYDDMPGLLSGRHRGAKEAQGEILAYLDDDVLLAPSWLEALKDAFSDPEVALVGGPSTPQYEIDPPAWLNALWSEFEGGRMCGALSLIELGNVKRPTNPTWVWGLNFSIRKKVLYECGGFHPDCVPKALQRYQGDGEIGLSLKIKAKGLLAFYSPNVAVTHLIPASRLTLGAFEQRAFFQGVCDSYTRIRREKTVSSASGKSWKDMLWPIARKIYRTSLLCWDDAKFLGTLLGRAHAAGIGFHQNEVRRDPKLLEWVLRADYFDYSLPEGWENYVSFRQRKPIA